MIFFQTSSPYRLVPVTSMCWRFHLKPTISFTLCIISCNFLNHSGPFCWILHLFWTHGSLSYGQCFNLQETDFLNQSCCSFGMWHFWCVRLFISCKMTSSHMVQSRKMKVYKAVKRYKLPERVRRDRLWRLAPAKDFGIQAVKGQLSSLWVMLCKRDAVCVFMMNRNIGQHWE